jgi:hypothetical protein
MHKLYNFRKTLKNGKTFFYVNSKRVSREQFGFAELYCNAFSCFQMKCFEGGNTQLKIGTVGARA